MGCQVSSDGSQFEKSDFDRLWKRMNSISEPLPPAQDNKKRKGRSTKNKGWKIFRILLVSTFKDFRNERSAVLDLVENKLQSIASEKRIFLQVEDFSWGSKAHSEEASSLYLIERLCREAASSKALGFTYFYLHFLGECSGYLIDHTFLDDSFLRQHSLSHDQSHSEVFLQLAGLHHSNALFLYRDPSFLQELPFNVTNFIDTPVNRERAKYLTSMVKNGVPASKFVEYSVRTSGINNLQHKHILFDEMTGAVDPVEVMIIQYLENLDDVDERSPSTDVLIQEFYADLANDEETLQKISANIKSRKSTLVVGDYCTGKTALLWELKKKHPKAVFIHSTDGMSATELRRAIDAKTNESHDYDQKVTRILLVDDVHLMTKEAQQCLSGTQELIIVASSRKKKVNVEMDRVTIPSMDPEVILDELSYWLNGGIKEKTAVPSVKASNIFKNSQQKRRKSVGNVEDGQHAEENVGWNSLKCRIIGSLGRFGSSEEKCAQLSQLSTLSVVEADMCLMESDGRGHLLIATLCFLAIVESGLNEIELRRLLISEYELLPIGIRRNFRNLPFEYCPDEYGTSFHQIPPLRWYFVLNRLGHLLMNVDSYCNHFILPSACRRVVHKKFLKNSKNIEHFKKNLAVFLTDVSHEEWNRNGEVKKFTN